jgi:protein-tyrosine phosphatase/rhodanese-related sulfurtransferase
MRRLFRRHSSIKVCPEDGDACETPPGGGSTPSSPPIESSKSTFLLFSGTFSPITMRESTDVEEGFLTPTQLYNSMNDGQLSPYMFDPLFMLIIDTRSLDDYDKMHISTAVHATDLHDESKTKSLENYTLIVLYDHKGLSHSLSQSVLTSTMNSIHSQGMEAFILAGGFDCFRERHPYMCSPHVPQSHLERQMLICDYPSIVVEDSLFLGRADQAANPRVKSNLGITHIINVTRDQPNAFPDEIQYLRIEVDDDATADLLHEFPTLIHFIKSTLSQQGRLLVHCNLGRSRSSTVVIAYLMFCRKWSLRDAYTYLKDRRPIIHPNRNFVSQLSKFEELLFGRKLTDSDNIHKGL